MSETIVNPAEISNELVALYLLASIAANEPATSVQIKDGVPLIAGKDKGWILQNYVDCLRTISKRAVQ